MTIWAISFTIAMHYSGDTSLHKICGLNFKQQPVEIAQKPIYSDCDIIIEGE